MSPFKKLAIVYHKILALSFVMPPPNVVKEKVQINFHKYHLKANKRATFPTIPRTLCMVVAKPQPRCYTVRWLSTFDGST
jgi:hypothetical protein